MIWTFPENGAPMAPYPVFRLGSFWACETPEGILALTGKLPWGQLPSFSFDLPNQRVHYHGFRGWDAELWYDGPEFSWAQGAVTACVLPGTDAPLPAGQVRDPDEFSDWIQTNEVLAWKKSLARAFRARFTFAHGAYRLQGLGSHPSHALVLLGLRLAFPHTVFYALDHPGDWKPQWKRYCQNLNLSTWAAPSQVKGLATLNVAELSLAWPTESAARFLQNLNTRIPIVPGKLLRSFSSP